MTKNKKKVVPNEELIEEGVGLILFTRDDLPTEPISLEAFNYILAAKSDSGLAIGDNLMSICEVLEVDNVTWMGAPKGETLNKGYVDVTIKVKFEGIPFDLLNLSEGSSGIEIEELEEAQVTEADEQIPVYDVRKLVNQIEQQYPDADEELRKQILQQRIDYVLKHGNVARRHFGLPFKRIDLAYLDQLPKKKKEMPYPDYNIPSISLERAIKQFPDAHAIGELIQMSQGEIQFIPISESISSKVKYEDARIIVASTKGKANMYLNVMAKNKDFVDKFTRSDGSNKLTTYKLADISFNETMIKRKCYVINHVHDAIADLCG